MAGKKYKAGKNVTSKHQSIRIAKLEGILSHRNVVSKEYLMNELEVSFATLKRDIAYMKDFLDADIEFDREAGGYRYKKDSVDKKKIPSSWFTPSEVYSLLMMHHLFSNMDRGGLLNDQINPMLVRIKSMLGVTEDPYSEIKKRVRIDTRGTRPQNPDHFPIIGQALLARKKLVLTYDAKSNDEITVREVSPQSMIFYRGNWYLDAHCHLRDKLRSFAMDSILECSYGEGKAIEVKPDILARHFASGYGIFGGEDVKIAKLKFSKERARWVSKELWHKDQNAHFDEKGDYILEVPYSDHREILMDILKHGRHCQVLAPECLKKTYDDEVNTMFNISQNS